jgi:hypothetical protein
MRIMKGWRRTDDAHAGRSSTVPCAEIKNSYMRGSNDQETSFDDTAPEIITRHGPAHTAGNQKHSVRMESEHL